MYQLIIIINMITKIGKVNVETNQRIVLNINGNSVHALICTNNFRIDGRTEIRIDLGACGDIPNGFEGNVVGFWFSDDDSIDDRNSDTKVVLGGVEYDGKMLYAELQKYIKDYLN
jgi:pyruvate carboxylase